VLQALSRTCQQLREVQTMQPLTYKRLINKKTLLEMIPLCDRTIYNMEQRGDFPQRIALTRRNVVWDLADIEKWIESRKSLDIKVRRPGED